MTETVVIRRGTGWNCRTHVSLWNVAGVVSEELQVPEVLFD